MNLCGLAPQLSRMTFSLCFGCVLTNSSLYILPYWGSCVITSQGLISYLTHSGDSPLPKFRQKTGFCVCFFFLSLHFWDFITDLFWNPLPCVHLKMSFLFFPQPLKLFCCLLCAVLCRTSWYLFTLISWLKCSSLSHLSPSASMIFITLGCYLPFHHSAARSLKSLLYCVGFSVTVSGASK